MRVISQASNDAMGLVIEYKYPHYHTQGDLVQVGTKRNKLLSKMISEDYKVILCFIKDSF